MDKEQLVALIEHRNAANDNAPPLYGSNRQPITLLAVQSYLKAVKRGNADSRWMNETPAASFCGAAGLVKIRGRFAELTERGRAVA